MIDKYILIDKKPVPCYNVLEWAEWYETADRIVDKTIIGNIVVSTVFLGIDQSFRQGGAPILFETICFCIHCGAVKRAAVRCSTWAQAEKQHAAIVGEIILSEIPENPVIILTKNSLLIQRLKNRRAYAKNN